MACSMPCRPGLEANIQPLKMRRYLLSRVTSSTSTKPVVFGFSVGGRVKHILGVSCRAPNCTVSSTATSNEMIRPVILSSPEKTAVGFLILSANAGPAAKVAQASAAAAKGRVRGMGRPQLKFGAQRSLSVVEGVNMRTVLEKGRPQGRHHEASHRPSSHHLLLCPPGNLWAAPAHAAPSRQPRPASCPDRA